MTSTALRVLMDAIATADADGVARRLASAPGLATARLQEGATRAAPKPNWLAAITHYVYAGDTALHVAAAGHRVAIARLLIDRGAALDARNRRDATPLHYAADGGPGAPGWDPEAQAATVTLLIAAGPPSAA